MKTGNGKIANLPSQIRDELNWRLNDGESGSELVEWLNAKPEVIEVVNKLFDGKPISEQNLSQWRTHGYRQWHAYHIIVHETVALSQNSGPIEATGINCEKLLLALTANYAEMIQRWIITPTDQMDYRMEVFKNITAAVLALRRAEIQKARLEIERERLELLREKHRNKSSSSSSSAPSSSAQSRPTENDSPASAEPAPQPLTAPPNPAPRPSTPPPASSTPSMPSTAANPPPASKIPPYRDPHSRYSLL